MPYNDSGFVSNGYNGTSMNGGSVAPSPTPYVQNGYNGNGYASYTENGSTIGTSSVNGTTYNENGSSVNGNGINGGTGFVRRRLLPAIPKGGKKNLSLLFCGFIF